MSRHKRAFMVTLPVAMVLGSLCFSYFMIKKNYQSASSSAYEKVIENLHVKDSQDQNWEPQRFLNLVSVIAVFPEKFSEDHLLNSEDQFKTLWEALKERFNEHPKLKAQVQFLYFSPNKRSALDEKWHYLAYDRLFVENKENFRFDHLDERQKNHISLVVVDGNAMVRDVFFHEQIVQAKAIQATISKLVFNKNLDQYLTKRTFFGPAKSAIKNPSQL